MSKATGIKGVTPHKFERIKRAEIRKVNRAERSPEQQLALLVNRPGRSLRESRRLLS